MEKRRILEGAIQIPNGIIKYGSRVVGQTVEVFLAGQAQGEFVGKLVTDHLLADAKDAFDEVKLGEQTRIPEVEFEGRARLARCALKAFENPVVPDETVSTLVHMADEVEVDTQFEPELEDDEQDTYREVHDRYLHAGIPTQRGPSD